jgi:FKBP-type peptidyl-prolyl cis-trans isomerase FklB
MVYAQQPAAPNPTQPAAEGLPSAGAAGPASSGLKTLKERSSYALGVDIGRDFKQHGLDLDPNLVARGLADAMNGKNAMSDKEMHETMNEFQNVVQAQRRQLAMQLSEKNKKDGAAFQATNKQREGVKTLADGLQYKVLKQGIGASPKANDNVLVNYRGTLVDGTEFDSSYRRRQPLEISVSGVIPGWTEALQMMHEGDKWQLVIPSDLAYGKAGSPPVIGPDATLVFDVELLKVTPANATAPAANPNPQ